MGDVRNIITFKRNGPGLGDTVTIEPAIAGWKALMPEAEIRFIGVRPILTILENHPAIDQLGTADEVEAAGMVFELWDPCPTPKHEGAGGSPVTKDRVEIFADRCYLKKPGIPKIYLTAEEEAFGRAYLLEKSCDPANTVAVVLRCAEPWRNFEQIESLAAEIMDDKVGKGRDVILIDHEIEIANVAGTKGLRIRQLAAVINAAALTVTPDTGWAHVAGALGKPIYGLFGSIDPEMRLGRYFSDGRPGRWWTGHCPYGLQPCWYKLCVSKTDIPPCLKVLNDVEMNGIINGIETVMGEIGSVRKI